MQTLPRTLERQTEATVSTWDGAVGFSSGAVMQSRQTSLRAPGSPDGDTHESPRCAPRTTHPQECNRSLLKCSLFWNSGLFLLIKELPLNHQV